MSPEVKLKWTDVEHKESDDIKHTILNGTLLAYLEFNKRFDIHTDFRDYQLWEVVGHHGKPIASYSCKLTKTQTRYTIREKEFISIVKTLK